jgi:hypothetical protein
MAISGWRDTSELQALADDNEGRMILTYGHLFGITKEKMLLVQNRNDAGGENARWGETMEIPLDAIVDVRMLEIGRGYKWK